jgi:hypothetical protein
MGFIILLAWCLINKRNKAMTAENQTCVSDNLEVQISTKNVVRFKAGAELSGKVNKVDVAVSEEVDETSETFGLKIVISRTACTYNDREI